MSLRLGSHGVLIALSAAIAMASCLATSNFDGLNGKGGGPASSGSGGQATTSPTTGGGGSSGAGASNAGVGGVGGPMATTGTEGGAAGHGGSNCMPNSDPTHFPATCVLDTFNRDDGPPGNAFLVQIGGKYLIKGHRLVGVGSVQSDGVDPQAILWASPFGVNQEVFVTFVDFSAQDTELELLLKAQGGAQECDALEMAYHQGVLHAFKCEDNTFLQLSPTAGVPVQFAPGDQLGARYEEGMLTAYVNGHVTASWDATAFSSRDLDGKIGIFLDGIPDAVTLDDFGGGTL